LVDTPSGFEAFAEFFQFIKAVEPVFDCVRVCGGGVILDDLFPNRLDAGAIRDFIGTLLHLINDGLTEAERRFWDHWFDVVKARDNRAGGADGDFRDARRSIDDVFVAADRRNCGQADDISAAGKFAFPEGSMKRGGTGKEGDEKECFHSDESIAVLGWESSELEGGETAGDRTQDPRLKRPLLYQLSYRLINDLQLHS
jgi:hypothetical protein